MFLSITLHIAEVLEILAMMFLYLPAVISTGKNVVVNMYVMRAAEKQYGFFFYCGQQQFQLFFSFLTNCLSNLMLINLEINNVNKYFVKKVIFVCVYI